MTFVRCWSTFFAVAMGKTSDESQLPLAVAGIGVVIAQALLERDPALHYPLKRVVVNHIMEDRGEGWELVADSLKTFADALYNRELFPLPKEEREVPSPVRQQNVRVRFCGPPITQEKGAQQIALVSRLLIGNAHQIPIELAKANDRPRPSKRQLFISPQRGPGAIVGVRTLLELQ